MMYVEEISVGFHQGDVIRGVPFCLMRNDSIFDEDDKFLNTTIEISKKPAVLISHDCDINPENKGKSPWLLICPIEDVPRPLRDEYKNMDDINHLGEGKETYVGYFYYHPHESMDGNDFVVRFNRLFSIKKTWLDRGVKLIEISEEYRQLLQDKIAFSFITNHEK